MNFSILPKLSNSSAQERNHLSSSLLICTNMNFSQLCHMPGHTLSMALISHIAKIGSSSWKWVSWSLCKSLSVWTQCELVHSSVLFLGRTHTHTHTQTAVGQQQQLVSTWTDQPQAGKLMTFVRAFDWTYVRWAVWQGPQGHTHTCAHTHIATVQSTGTCIHTYKCKYLLWQSFDLITK